MTVLTSMVSRQEVRHALVGDRPRGPARAFYTDHQHGLYSMAELCARYGISRKTGYQWWACASQPSLTNTGQVKCSKTVSVTCRDRGLQQRPQSELNLA